MDIDTVVVIRFWTSEKVSSGHWTLGSSTGSK